MIAALSACAAAGFAIGARAMAAFIAAASIIDTQWKEW